jgi:hypothetical protein
MALIVRLIAVRTTRETTRGANNAQVRPSVMLGGVASLDDAVHPQ